MDAIILSVEIDFSEWLQKEIDQRGWSWNKLADVAGLSSGTIYNIRDGTRGAGKASLEAIASALKLPPETVFDAAGFIVQKNKEDQTIQEAAHLVSLLNEDNRRVALGILRTLVAEQDFRSGKK